jgi:hypothetical protein
LYLVDEVPQINYLIDECFSRGVQLPGEFVKMFMMLQIRAVVVPEDERALSS